MRQIKPAQLAFRWTINFAYFGLKLADIDNIHGHFALNSVSRPYVLAEAWLSKLDY